MRATAIQTSRWLTSWKPTSSGPASIVPDMKVKRSLLGMLTLGMILCGCFDTPNEEHVSDATMATPPDPDAHYAYTQEELFVERGENQIYGILYLPQDVQGRCRLSSTPTAMAERTRMGRPTPRHWPKRAMRSIVLTSAAAIPTAKAMAVRWTCPSLPSRKT